MARKYTVFLKGREEKVTNEELSNYADLIGINNSYRSRISELLILDIYIYDKEFGVNPRDIIEEIDNLENGDHNTQTKPASAFRKLPLAGLWHKHYFSAEFLVPNMQNALKGGKLKSLIEEVMDPSKSSVITPEMISEFAHRVTHEPVEDRTNANKLTGEWIIFAKENGENYYLCLNTHEAGDQTIADRIKDNCVREYSFLSTFFTPENA